MACDAAALRGPQPPTRVGGRVLENGRGFQTQKGRKVSLNLIYYEHKTVGIFKKYEKLDAGPSFEIARYEEQKC